MRTGLLLQVSLTLGLVGMYPASLQAMVPAGPPLKKISSDIRSWEPIDDKHIVVSLSPSKSYLLTLRRECPTLSHATNVGVSASNNRIYAGFDYITADGSKCPIAAINKLSEAQKKALSHL
ncbi:MAG: DUF6491 family protein [Pseudomonadota bacterium]